MIHRGDAEETRRKAKRESFLRVLSPRLPGNSAPSATFSSPWVFSAIPPRLPVSASNGPRRWPVGSFLAPRTSTSIDACAPRKLRSLSDLFLTLGLLRVCSASPCLRVEWAPPLACREFPRPENIDINRCLCSAETPLPQRPFPHLGSSPRFLRVSVSPRRMGPAAGPSGVSSPREHRHQSMPVLPGNSAPSATFSSPWVFSAFAPRLPVSASNGPRRWPVGSFLAPRTSTSIDACAPRKLRSLSDLFLTLGLLRVCSASPCLRVEWAPPLARREFPRPENIDINRCLCSAETPLPQRPFPHLGSSPRLLRVSVSPRRVGPAPDSGPSGVSSPREHRHQSMPVFRRNSAPSATFSSPWVFSAIPPRLRVSASNGPRRWPVGSFLAPRTSTSIDACVPRKLRSRSDLFLTLGLLRDSSASPCLRVEWAPRPTLARREFPRPRNIDINRCLCSAETPLPQRPFPHLGSSPRFLRVSVSPRRMGPAPDSGPSGVSSPQEHR